MLYKLLGMLVWRAGKRVLRRRYGVAMAPPAVLAAGLVAVLLGVAALLRSRAGGSS
jgi:hypothetical protein